MNNVKQSEATKLRTALGDAFLEWVNKATTILLNPYEAAAEMATTQHKHLHQAVRPPRFSLATFFVAIALLGVCLALVRGFDAVLGAYAALLACVWFFARRMGRKGIIACLIITSMFSIIPWCDVGGGVFITFQGTRPLPTIPVSNQLREALKPVYSISSLPLEMPAHFIHGSFADVIYFSGEGRSVVRPFVVFVFWASISLMIAVAFMMRWQRGHH